MAAEVKILIEGDPEKNCPTITLVKDENIVMLVDPGILESQQILIDKLEQEDLDVSDINFICITHSHIDHYRNIGMFPEAKTLEFFGIWDKSSVKDLPQFLTENIEIIKTPGHDVTSITLLVKTTKEKVAICGDVFWKKDYPEVDVYASSLEQLQESRKKVIEMASIIIPGHGKAFRPGKKIENYGKEIKKPARTNGKGLGKCKSCKIFFAKIEDKCECQPYLCYKCCECDTDCELCNCKHKR